MPRTLWKGALSFGLVTIPVRLHPAVEEKTVAFNQLRASDHSRIAYKRVARADGEEVDYGDIVKGYEHEPDRYVVFTADELDALRPSSSRTIEILQFVPLTQIDPIFFARSYYLTPDPAGAKAYRLLAQAMGERSAVGICKVALRDKEHLATLRLRDDLFVISTMHWPDEIRALRWDDLDLGEVAEPRTQEVAMARTLIDNLTEDFEPGSHRDEFRERVLAAVRAKVEGQQVTVLSEGGEPAAVVDLMEALRASVEAARRRQDDDAVARDAEQSDADEAASGGAAASGGR